MTLSSISFKRNLSIKNNSKKTKQVQPTEFQCSCVALLGGTLVTTSLPYPLTSLIISQVKQRYGSVNPSENKAYMDAFKTMLKESGLKDKGLRLRFLEPLKKKKQKPKLFSEEFIETFSRRRVDKNVINVVRDNSDGFFLPRDFKLRDFKVSEIKELLKKGDFKSALEKFQHKKTYIKGNTVAVSKKGMQILGFHEMGHAINFHFSKLSQCLDKFRGIALKAPFLLLLYAAFSKKSKPKDENDRLTGLQKLNNFIRNNVGKLTVISMLPILIEEGMATYNGQKYANKLLKPKLAKKVLKTNLLAGSTYLISAAFAGLGAWLTVKMKNNAVDSLEADKLREKQKLAKDIN